MTEETLNNVLCSTTSNIFKYTLLFDGLETYYLFHDGEEIAKINEALTPRELHKQTKGYTLAQIKENPANSDVILTLINELESTLKNNFEILGCFKNILNTLSNAEESSIKNMQNLNIAPANVKEVFRDLTAKYGIENKELEDLLNPIDIDSRIKFREEPVLTTKEKAKADEIAKAINENGLLPYLDNILKDIHIGEHKNIYRKMLMLFKIMRGEASFLSETTAKAEAGKSFEDEIVFNLMAPQRYIFKVNDITPASFKRYGALNPYYFDRQVILFGDLGSKKSFTQIEDVFNIFKVLITENEYNSSKADKNDELSTIEIHLKVNSIGAVYSTIENSFTKDDNQLISRTLFSTPAIVEDKLIMEQQFYLQFSKSRQSKARELAEQKLKDFGLYLMQMVNCKIEIVNPYIDIFMDYSLKSENPIRELKQQLELFNAYCILTQDKCIINYQGTKWASLEQLKEYMDYINLENALIPYEFDFLQMIMAKKKQNELKIVYADVLDSDGNLLDIDLNAILTLTECENYAMELINNQLRQKYKQKLKSNGFNEVEIEKKLEDYEPIKTKADLSPGTLKEMPYKLVIGYGLRNAGADHKAKAFFRYSDIKNLYSRYNAFKNVENVPKLLQSLYNKGYLGKYEYKHGKENLYYLTPKCETLLTKFETDKSFDDYATDFIANTGYENY